MENIKKKRHFCVPNLRVCVREFSMLCSNVGLIWNFQCLKLWSEIPMIKYCLPYCVVYCKQYFSMPLMKILNVWMLKMKYLCFLWSILSYRCVDSNLSSFYCVFFHKLTLCKLSISSSIYYVYVFFVHHLYVAVLWIIDRHHNYLLPSIDIFIAYSCLQLFTLILSFQFHYHFLPYKMFSHLDFYILTCIILMPLVYIFFFFQKFFSSSSSFNSEYCFSSKCSCFLISSRICYFIYWQSWYLFCSCTSKHCPRCKPFLLIYLSKTVTEKVEN